MPRMSAPAPSPKTSTRTRSRTRSWPRSSAARQRNEEGQCDDEDGKEHERDRDRGTERPPPLDDADPVDEQPGCPQSEAGQEGVEDSDAGARVGSAGAKRVAAVHGEAHGPYEHEPENERRGGEREHVAGSPIAATAAGALQADEQGGAAGPVRCRAVHSAREEENDGDDGEAPVDERLIEQPSRRGREQHARETGKENDREHGLLPGFGLPVRLVAERSEDCPRALEHRQRAEPPLLLTALARIPRRARGLAGHSQAAAAATPGSTWRRNWPV